MLYFYVDKHKRARKGIPADRFSSDRLYRRHDRAEADDRGRVLLVDTQKIRAPLDEVENVPRKALLNVNPYVPTQERIAGGGILTKQGKKGLKMLLIFRKGKWDLPKGKLDPGETIKQCAKREVCEELGIDKVKVIRFLDTTVHGYKERPDHFLVKTTHWYHMTTKATTFVPQLDEKITEVTWVRYDKALKKLGHDSLVRLLKRVEHKLH